MEPLYTRVFTEDELVMLIRAVDIFHRISVALEHPASVLERAEDLELRLFGDDYLLEQPA